MPHACVLVILSHADRSLLRFAHLYNHWGPTTHSVIHKQMCPWTGATIGGATFWASPELIMFGKHMLSWLCRRSRKQCWRLTAPTMTLFLSSVHRNPWKKVCERNAVSRITNAQQQTDCTPSGLKTSSVHKQNAAQSESPALSHLLTHVPTHTHAGRNTCLDTAGSARPRVSCQTLITCFLALETNWMLTEERLQRVWMKPDHLKFTHQWCEANSVRGEFKRSRPSEHYIRSGLCR